MAGAQQCSANDPQPKSLFTLPKGAKKHEVVEPDAIPLPHYLLSRTGFAERNTWNYWSAETLSSKIQAITIAGSSGFPMD